MTQLRRIVLVRHGETEGESSVRFHGSADVALSDSGREQMRGAARGLRRGVFDLVVASCLRRSWEGAWIVAGGAQVRLEPDFCEIDFGRWEGMTREEIEASDPSLYQEWQGRAPGFEFPGGERRADFQARVGRGLERLLASGATSALVVVHKGIVRTIAERLTGEPLADGEPPLGGMVELVAGAGGTWTLGARPSNPVAHERPTQVGAAAGSSA